MDNAKIKAMLESDVEEVTYQDAPEDEVLVEAPDLILESFEHQITDEPADPIRQRASAHRAVAYLDPYYPPFGASSGQEGGSMRPMEEIEIFGDSYAHGLDVLGAGYPKRQPRAGFVKSKTPTGKTVITMKVNRPKIGDYRTSIQNARDVGQRAVANSERLLKLVERAKKRAKAAAKGKTTVKGDDITIGAKVKVSLSKIEKVAKRNRDAGKKLLERAKKFADKLKVTEARKLAAKKAMSARYGAKLDKRLAQKHVAAKPAAKAAAAAKPVATSRAATLVRPGAGAATRLRGDDYEAMTQYFGALGDVFGDEIEAHDLDAMADQAASEILGDEQIEVEEAAVSESDFGIPKPTLADVQAQWAETAMSDPGTYTKVWNETPTGAVTYDSSKKPFSLGAVGSHSRFFPEDGVRGGKSSGFQWGSDKFSDGWYTYWQDDWYTKWKHDEPGGEDRLKQAGIDDSGLDSRTVQKRSEISNRIGWGPLIGNPNLPDWKGLRYNAKDDVWFWFYNTAPAWAKDEIDQTNLAQALQDYQTELLAAKDEAATKALADKLEKEEAEALAKAQAKEAQAQDHRLQMEEKEASSQRSREEAQAESELKAAKASEEAAAEVEAKRAEAEDERLMKMMERAAEMEERAAVREEERELELAKRLDEASAADEGATEGGEAEEVAPEGEEHFFDESGEAAFELEEAPMETLPAVEPTDEVEEEVLGSLHGLRKFRALRRHRAHK